MITRSMSAIAVLAMAVAAAVRAQARSYGRDEYGSGNWPSEIIERPLTLAQDLAQLDVPVVFNLIDSTMWKPVFIPERLAYGVNSDVTLAVTHQVGFCLNRPTNGYLKLYNDVELETLIAIMPTGPLQAALRAGMELPSIPDRIVPFTVLRVQPRPSRSWTCAATSYRAQLAPWSARPSPHCVSKFPQHCRPCACETLTRPRWRACHCQTQSAPARLATGIAHDLALSKWWTLPGRSEHRRQAPPHGSARDPREFPVNPVHAGREGHRIGDRHARKQVRRREGSVAGSPDQDHILQFLDRLRRAVDDDQFVRDSRQLE